MLKKHNAIILHEIVEATSNDDDKNNRLPFEDIFYDSFNKIISKGIICRSVVKAASLDPLSKPGIILTFDDGHKSDIELALPLIQCANFTATFFIVPNLIGTESFMNWTDVRRLFNAGMEIGSHSMNHSDFRHLDENTASLELTSSKSEIENKIGSSIKSFSFPFGFAPKKHIELAKTIGYENIMGSQHGLIGEFDRTLMPRNSIHGQMSDKQINATLIASRPLQVRWKTEDTIKPILKKILPNSTYNRIRKLVAGGTRSI